MKFEDFQLDIVYRDPCGNKWKVVCKSARWVVLVSPDRNDFYIHYPSKSNQEIQMKEVN